MAKETKPRLVRTGSTEDAPPLEVGGIESDCVRVDAIIGTDRAALLAALDASGVPAALASELVRAQVVACDQSRALALATHDLAPYLATARAWRAVLSHVSKG